MKEKWTREIKPKREMKMNAEKPDARSPEGDGESVGLLTVERQEREGGKRCVPWATVFQN